MEIHYTSLIVSEHLAELEDLLFFNPGQTRVRESILAAIKTHGAPHVVVRSGRLTIELQGGRAIQTLFACARDDFGERLAGVLVYTREDFETLRALGLAVAPDFSSSGRYANERLVLRFSTKLREIAAQIRGVRRVMLSYRPDQLRVFRVGPAPIPLQTAVAS